MVAQFESEALRGHGCPLTQHMAAERQQKGSRKATERQQNNDRPGEFVRWRVPMVGWPKLISEMVGPNGRSPGINFPRW